NNNLQERETQRNAASQPKGTGGAGMDAGNSIRRQPKPKALGERMSSAVMEPPYDTEEMAEPSATGNMPGEGMQDPGLGAPPATGNMPGEGMQDAAMGTPSALGNMPGEGMQSAPIEA